LRAPWPIDLGLTVASHGWVHLEPWRWESETGTLSHAERIDGRMGTIAVRQRDPRTLTVAWDGLPDDAVAEILRRVGRWVSAEWDPAAAIAALGARFGDEVALIAAGGGRLLRGSAFYEDFVKTVLTVNTSWSGTCRMSAALVAEPGGGAFPTPDMVLDYGELRLRERAKLGFRAPTVIAATRGMLDDGVIDRDGHGRPDRLDHDYLTGFKGIGPYAAAHCRMLLHDFSRIPIDSVVVAHLRERHDTTPAEFIAGRAECGEYLGLGYRLMRLREKFAVPDLELGQPSPPAPISGRIAADYEVTDYEPNSRLAFRTIAGPVRPTGEFRFDEVDGGTRLTFTLGAELSGLKKLLMGGPVQKTMTAEVAATERLKQVLESAGVA
jgi:3-methyladenine DNA glycosylase/8-oxoguanine DNA glycosylase